MDSFDRLILDSLKDGSAKTFIEILAKGGLSHNTLKRHLQRLMSEDLILRAEKVENRRGRPKYSYTLIQKLRRQVNLTLKEPHTSLVTLTKLKQTCKHSKGGFCRTKRRNCGPYVCLHIIRE
jgi:predicted ArsR family transcriptional regulator